MKAKANTLQAIGLCSGLGAFEMAAEENGVFIKATAEINKDANLSSFLNFGRQPLGDIRLINGAELAPVDIVLAGSSCKGFSLAGQQKGFAHPEGDLLFHCIRIAMEAGAKLIVAENVPAIQSHSKHRSLEIINEFLVRCGFEPFQWRILNSAHWGLPTARKRWYACSFRNGLHVRPLEWPDFKMPFAHIRSVLLNDDRVTDLYINTSEFIDEHRDPPLDPYAPWRVGYIRKIYRERMVWAIDAVSPTFMAGIGGPGGPSGLYRMDDGRIRQLHPHEMLAAMGFTKGFRLPFRGYRGGRLVGNSLVPKCARSVIAMAIKAMTGEEVAA